MPFNKCLKCSADVRQQDSFCWKCGASMTSATKPASTQQNSVVGCGIVLVLLFVVGMCVNTVDESSETAPARSHDEITAYTMCQKFVEDRLKAPRTAKFPWSASELTTDLGDGRYQVRAHVDAENSFGAMLRTRFVCTVQWVSGETWHLESLEFPDRNL